MSAAHLRLRAALTCAKVGGEDSRRHGTTVPPLFARSRASFARSILWGLVASILCHILRPRNVSRASAHSLLKQYHGFASPLGRLRRLNDRPEPAYVLFHVGCELSRLASHGKITEVGQTLCHVGRSQYGRQSALYRVDRIFWRPALANQPYQLLNSYFGTQPLLNRGALRALAVTTSGVCPPLPMSRLRQSPVFAACGSLIERTEA